MFIINSIVVYSDSAGNKTSWS